MKKQLLKVIQELKREELDFEKTPPLFKWSYDEHPELEFQMLIIKKPPQNVQEIAGNNTIH